MPLAYVLDEHLRGSLWRAVQRHNLLGVDPLDVVRVGDPPDLPLGASDPELLAWAERAGRILVSRDKRTLVTHLNHHLQASHHSPGVFLIRPRSLLSEVLEFLVIAAFASDPGEWSDRIEYIP